MGVSRAIKVFKKKLFKHVWSPCSRVRGLCKAQKNNQDCGNNKKQILNHFLPDPLIDIENGLLAMNNYITQVDISTLVQPSELPN